MTVTSAIFEIKKKQFQIMSGELLILEGFLYNRPQVLMGLTSVCLCVCVCCIRPMLTWRPGGLRSLSCWRIQLESLAVAHLCLTLLALLQLLTQSVSLTTQTCRCVSHTLSLRLSTSFSLSVSLPSPLHLPVTFSFIDINPFNTSA